MRYRTNRSLSRLGRALDFNVSSIWVDTRHVWAFQFFDWTNIRLSYDFDHFSEIYSTFIPKYMKIKWVPNIQSNASGYYVYGNIGGALPQEQRTYIYTMTDGFSTIRYDNVDGPIGNNSGMQYSSFKTFDPSKRWSAIVYPRRSQMVAPRQKFADYVPANIVANDTHRGMGRLWIQALVAWEDSNHVQGVPPNPVYSPDIATQVERLNQIGHFYVNYYMYTFDRR